MRIFFVVLFLCVSPAIGLAELLVTNGDFETGAPATGDNQADVSGWFDDNVQDVGWWMDTWHANNNLPVPGAAVGFSEAGGQDSLYQSIGTIDEAGTVLHFAMDLYAFTDDGAAGRSGTLGVEIYQGPFAGAADGVDISTAGLTFIGAASKTTPVLLPGDTTSVAGLIDLSSANLTEEIWARIVWNGDWMAGDNFVVTAVPEPSTYTSLVLTGLVLGWRRRKEELIRHRGMQSK